MSTTGLSAKSTGDKSLGSKKFNAVNINNVYSGKSLVQKSSAPLKHGLQSLGKAPVVARRMPPPADLPSLRAESSGQDPSVNLVPTGGAGWGTQTGQTSTGQKPGQPQIDSQTQIAASEEGTSDVNNVAARLSGAVGGSSTSTGTSQSSTAGNQIYAAALNSGDNLTSETSKAGNWTHHGGTALSSTGNAGGFFGTHSSREFPQLAGADSAQAKSSSNTATKNASSLSLRPQKASWKAGSLGSKAAPAESEEESTSPPVPNTNAQNGAPRGAGAPSRSGGPQAGYPTTGGGATRPNFVGSGDYMPPNAAYPSYNNTKGGGIPHSYSAPGPGPGLGTQGQGGHMNRGFPPMYPPYPPPPQYGYYPQHPPGAMRFPAPNLHYDGGQYQGYSRPSGGAYNYPPTRMPPATRDRIASSTGTSDFEEYQEDGSGRKVAQEFIRQRPNREAMSDDEVADKHFDRSINPRQQPAPRCRSVYSDTEEDREHDGHKHQQMDRPPQRYRQPAAPQWFPPPHPMYYDRNYMMYGPGPGPPPAFRHPSRSDGSGGYMPDYSGPGGDAHDFEGDEEDEARLYVKSRRQQNDKEAVIQKARNRRIGNQLSVSSDGPPPPHSVSHMPNDYRGHPEPSDEFDESGSDRPSSRDSSLKGSMMRNSYNTSSVRKRGPPQRQIGNWEFDAAVQHRNEGHEPDNRERGREMCESNAPENFFQQSRKPNELVTEKTGRHEDSYNQQRTRPSGNEASALREQSYPHDRSARGDLPNLRDRQYIEKDKEGEDVKNRQHHHAATKVPKDAQRQSYQHERSSGVRQDRVTSSRESDGSQRPRINGHATQEEGSAKYEERQRNEDVWDSPKVDEQTYDDDVLPMESLKPATRAVQRTFASSHSQDKLPSQQQQVSTGKDNLRQSHSSSSLIDSVSVRNKQSQIVTEKSSELQHKPAFKSENAQVATSAEGGAEVVVADNVWEKRKQQQKASIEEQEDKTKFVNAKEESEFVDHDLPTRKQHQSQDARYAEDYQSRGTRMARGVRGGSRSRGRREFVPTRRGRGMSVPETRDRGSRVAPRNVANTSSRDTRVHNNQNTHGTEEFPKQEPWGAVAEDNATDKIQTPDEANPTTDSGAHLSAQAGDAETSSVSHQSEGVNRQQQNRNREKPPTPRSRGFGTRGRRGSRGGFSNSNYGNYDRRDYNNYGYAEDDYSYQDRMGSAQQNQYSSRGRTIFNSVGRGGQSRDARGRSSIRGCHNAFDRSGPGRSGGGREQRRNYDANQNENAGDEENKRKLPPDRSSQAENEDIDEAHPQSAAYKADVRPNSTTNRHGGRARIIPPRFQQQNSSASSGHADHVQRRRKPPSKTSAPSRRHDNAMSPGAHSDAQIEDQWETASESSDVGERRKRGDLTNGPEQPKFGPKSFSSQRPKRRGGPVAQNQTHTHWGPGSGPNRRGAGPPGQQSNEQNAPVAESNNSAERYGSNPKNLNCASAQMTSRPNQSKASNDSKVVEQNEKSVKRNSVVRKDQKVLKDSPITPRVESIRPCALAHVDISNIAGVVVIDDQPDLNTCSDSQDGFEQVMSRREKRARKENATAKSLSPSLSGSAANERSNKDRRSNRNVAQSEKTGGRKSQQKRPQERAHVDPQNDCGYFDIEIGYFNTQLPAVKQSSQNTMETWDSVEGELNMQTVTNAAYQQSAEVVGISNSSQDAALSKTGVEIWGSPQVRTTGPDSDLLASSNSIQNISNENSQKLTLSKAVEFTNGFEYCGAKIELPVKLDFTFDAGLCSAQESPSSTKSTSVVKQPTSNTVDAVNLNPSTDDLNIKIASVKSMWDPIGTNVKEGGQATSLFTNTNEASGVGAVDIVSSAASLMSAAVFEQQERESAAVLQQLDSLEVSRPFEQPAVASMSAELPEGSTFMNRSNSLLSKPHTSNPVIAKVKPQQHQLLDQASSVDSTTDTVQTDSFEKSSIPSVSAPEFIPAGALPLSMAVGESMFGTSGGIATQYSSIVSTNQQMQSLYFNSNAFSSSPFFANGSNSQQYAFDYSAGSISQNAPVNGTGSGTQYSGYPSGNYATLQQPALMHHIPAPMGSFTQPPPITGQRSSAGAQSPGYSPFSGAGVLGIAQEAQQLLNAAATSTSYGAVGSFGGSQVGAKFGSGPAVSAHANAYVYVQEPAATISINLNQPPPTVLVNRPGNSQIPMQQSAGQSSISSQGGSANYFGALPPHLNQSAGMEKFQNSMQSVGNAAIFMNSPPPATFLQQPPPAVNLTMPPSIAQFNPTVAPPTKFVPPSGVPSHSPFMGYQPHVAGSLPALPGLLVSGNKPSLLPREKMEREKDRRREKDLLVDIDRFINTEQQQNYAGYR